MMLKKTHNKQHHHVLTDHIAHISDHMLVYPVSVHPSSSSFEIHSVQVHFITAFLPLSKFQPYFILL